MKFFLDENFPKAVVSLLEGDGHECFDPRGTELEGSDDDLLLAEARRNGAILLTTDRDFFHTLQHKFPDHAGMVIIALKKPNRQAIIDRLKWLLHSFAESDLRGRAFQLRDRTWVARPPLPETDGKGEDAASKS